MVKADLVRSPAMPEVPSDKRLVLFDGTCNFCNASVLFIIDRDPREEFVFAPLESELGQRVIAERGPLPPGTDSLVLVEGDHLLTHSSAALTIATHLDAPWSWLGRMGLVVPSPVRDVFYRAFARRRYALFGRQDACRVPTPELRRRFLALSS
jgi:predicted DCC family thiol-disulfide oxidoreductase YuxK